MRYKYIILLISIVLLYSGCNSDANSNDSETADSSYPNLNSEYVNISLPIVLDLEYPEINDAYKDVKLPLVTELNI